MDNQETLQVTVADVVDLEEIERLHTVFLKYTQNKIKILFTFCGMLITVSHQIVQNCPPIIVHGSKDGTVNASNDDNDNHCIMEFTSMLPGHVRIKGVEANLYLAMDRNGLLYGESDPTKNSTIFIEQPEGPYSAYLSLKYRHKKWYIAIKKNGKIKSGPETKRGQHATHFLSLPV